MSRALYKPLGSARELRASLAGAAPPLATPAVWAPGPPSVAALTLPAIVNADHAPARGREHAVGGAFASGALHALLLAGALLWSQSIIDPAPEPIAVEVVVEQPAQSGSARASEPTAAEAPPPTAPASVAAAPPEPKLAPAAEPLPESAPTPLAAASPEPTPSPTEPTSTPLAVASPEPTPSPTEPTSTPLAVASPEPSPSPPEPTPTPLAVASPEPSPSPPELAPTPEPAVESRPAPLATALAEAPPTPVAPRAEPWPPKPAEPVKPATRALAKPKPQSRTALAQRSASAPAPAATTQAFGAAPGARAATAAIGDYRNSIFASISAHTRYPQAALDRRAEGVAKVRFSIDDAGRLTAVALAGSAGDQALDSDAPATVRRSAPFGPPPTGAPHDYVVPIRYRPE